MRKHLALVAVEENDIAGLGLGLAQLEPEPDALDLSRDLPPLQRVPRPPPREVFFRSALEIAMADIDEFALFDLGDEGGIVQFSRFSNRLFRAAARKPAAQPELLAGSRLPTACLDGLDADRSEYRRTKRTVSSRTRNTQRSARWSSHRASRYVARPIRLTAITRKIAKTSTPLAARHSPLTGDLPAMSRPANQYKDEKSTKQYNWLK